MPYLMFCSMSSCVPRHLPMIYKSRANFDTIRSRSREPRDLLMTSKSQFLCAITGKRQDENFGQFYKRGARFIGCLNSSRGVTRCCNMIAHLSLTGLHKFRAKFVATLKMPSPASISKPRLHEALSLQVKHAKITSFLFIYSKKMDRRPLNI